MAEIKTAETPQKKRKKELEEIRLRKGKKGGHVVTHIYKNYQAEGEPWQANEEDEHIFGDGEGEKLIGHLKKHMKIKGEDEENELEDENDDAEKGNAKHRERERASTSTDEEEEESEEKEGDK
jgi:hypothetical protein